MRLLIVFPVGLAMSVAGCETYYKNPESSPIARVRFVAASPDQKFTVTHYDASCGFGAGGGVMGTVGALSSAGSVPANVREKGNTQKMIGYDESHGPYQVERAVAADRNLIVTLWRLVDVRAGAMGFDTKTCTLTFQFTPRAEHQYEIVYAEVATSCSATAHQLRAANDGTVQRLPEPNFRLASQQCVGGTGTGVLH